LSLFFATRAYARAGRAAIKQEDYSAAIMYFELSLTEHNTPRVLTNLLETEKLRDQKTKRESVDMLDSTISVFIVSKASPERIKFLRETLLSIQNQVVPPIDCVCLLAMSMAN